MRGSQKIFLGRIVAALLFLSSAVSARTIWVATTGNDANSGTQLSPVQHIGYAVSIASTKVPIDTIMVKPGTYIDGVSVDRDVYITSQLGADSTTLNGQLLGVPIAFQAGITATTVLEGFSITRGSPSNIRILGNSDVYSSPEIRDCRIFDNAPGASASGGGIDMSYSLSYIHDNSFSGNHASRDGGAIFCASSAAYIFNNEFLNNLADSSGGAISFNYGSPTEAYSVVQNNIFRSNTSGFSGSALYTDNSGSNIMNNLFYQNVSQSVGGAIGLAQFVEPLLQNNIFAANQNYAIQCGSNYGYNFFTNAYYGNTPTTTPDCILGSNDIFNVDPQFEDAANGDFRLKAGSALINKGTALPLESVSIDYAGYPRTSGSAIDIGPYEYIECNLVPNFDYTPLTPCTGDIVAFTNLSDGFFDYTVWDYGNGEVDTITYNPDLPTMATTSYANAGTYRVRMTLVCPTDTSSDSTDIIVTAPPDATPLADIESGCVPLTVSFFYEDSLTTSSDRWDFGDGTTSTSAKPVHEFAVAGSYNVVLQRSNFCGSDIDSMTISVQEVPTVSFTVSPQLGDAPLPVQFTAQSLQQLTSIQWDFGDGSTGVSTFPALTINHTYQEPGIFTPTAMGINDCGEGVVVSASQPIQVSGFDLNFISADSLDPQMKVYSFWADTLIGAYNRNINLTARIEPANPRRGSVQATFANNPIKALDTTSVTLQLSPDLAVGDYLLRIIGKPPSNLPVDTLEIPFYSSSATICALTPNSIDFDTVVVDSVKVDSVKVQNTAALFSGLNLKVLNVASSTGQFVPVTTTSPSIIPGQFFWVKVEFHPNALARFDGTLTITTDDPRDPEKTVDLTGVGGVERQPPLVESTTPVAGSDGAMVDTRIDIDFSELLSTTPDQPGVVQVFSERMAGLVAGTLQEGGPVDNKTHWQFVPDANFPPFDTVDVTVSGTVADLVGNTLDGNGNGVGEGSPTDDYDFTFITGPAVYPGDCNNDGVVNEIDVLPIGVFFGMQGPARPTSTTNWEGKPAELWDDPRATYADANGDGTIDELDVLAIGPNWGSTHQYSSPTLSVDYDFSAHQENFKRLRQIISSMAGSDVGDKLIQVIESFSGDATLPEGYSLWQNHPNPFNPDTRISYTLPEATHVRLTVHNILGQTVKVLVDKDEGPGFKYVIWNGADQAGRQVSSGVYFYRLETPHYLEIRKMMKLQ